MIEMIGEKMMTLNQNMLFSSFLYLFLLNSSLILTLNESQQFILTCVIAMVLLIIYFKTNKHNTLNKESVSIKKIGFIIVVGLLVSLAIQFFIILITNQLFSVETVTNQIPAKKSVIFLLTTIFLNPIMEELIFRFSFVNWVGQKSSFGIGVVISSLLFMLMHTSGNLMIYFFLGVIFSICYKRSGSIVCSMIVHGMLNALVLWVN